MDKKAGAIHVMKTALFWVGFFALLFGYRLFGGHFTAGKSYLTMGVVLSLSSILLTFIFLRSERKTLRDIGLVWSDGTFGRLAFGTMAGVFTMGILLTVLVTLSPLGLAPISNPDYFVGLVWAGLIFMALSLMEEIAFRAYPLIQITRSWGVRPAIYITSIVFAFYHGVDLGNLLGPGVWGLYFGLAAIKTKGIAWPVGFHFGLNWVQGLFGLKPEHVDPLWMVVPKEGDGLFATDILGVVLQWLLLILGVVLIEWHIKSSSDPTATS